MCGPIVKEYQLRGEVIETQPSGSPCEFESNQICKALWNSLHLHVMYELVFDRVGEGALNIQE